MKPSKPLTAIEIKSQIIGKVLLGSYPPVFKYILALNHDGSLEGKNDYDHYDIGKWSLNEATGALTVHWQYGWDDATVYVYRHGGEFKLINSTTGNLHTVLHQTISLKENMKTYKL